MDSSTPLRTRKARTRVTREGWYWLFAAGMLILVGWFKAINLLMFLGYPMVVLWIVAVLGVGAGLGRLRVRRRVAEPIFARTPFVLEFELENAGRRSLIGLRLDDHGPHHRLSRFLPAVRPHGSEHFRETVTLPRRGWYTQQESHLTTGYPFGLAERDQVLVADRSLLVFPEIGALHRGRLRRFLVVGAPYVGRSRQRPVHHAAAQSDFHGLRPFRAGDSPRWIHWRTSARRGELMVREFEEEPNESLVLVLEPWVPGGGPPGVHTPGSPGGSSPEVHTGGLSGGGSPGVHAPGSPGAHELLERAISLAATICWEWCRRTGDRLVFAVAGPVPLVVDGVTGRPHALTVLECLATQVGSPQPDHAAVAGRLSALALPRAPVLVVSTRPTSLGETLSRALSRPVATVDVSSARGPDFFERAPGHAS